MVAKKASPKKKSSPSNKKEETELYLKDYVSDDVYDCLSNYYNIGREAYITVIGGEAINYYLPKNEKIKTGDFDLKFVVNPEFTTEESDLFKVNVKRLKVVNGLLKCLNSIRPPKNYHQLYPKLAIKIRNEPRIVYSEGAKMFYVDPFTGEEKFFFYSPNKVFTILLYYQKSSKDPLDNFGLLDLSLFYRRPKGYSFFGAKIYDSFLKPPFNKKVPIPFKAEDNIRYPTLPFMLFDNFRMSLIALDNLETSKDNSEMVKFWTKKLDKYWIKVNILLNAIEKRDNDSDKIEKVEKQMRNTYKLYQPLAFLNMLCYREGVVYTDKLNDDKKECDSSYLKDLKEFEESYLRTGELVNELKY